MDSYGTSQETRGRSRSRSTTSSRSRQRRRYSSSRSSSASASRARARRGTVPNNRTMVVSRNLKTNSFLPNRIECVMCTVGDFYYPVASMTAAAGNFFNIAPNSRTPLQGNTYQITTGTGTATYANNASVAQGTAIANTPIGWTQYSTLYNNYRVKKYRVEITFLPQNVSDSVRLIVFPLGGESIPSATAGNVNTRVFEAQPGAKAITCAVSTAASPSMCNTIVYYGDCAKDLGKTMVDYMGLADTASSAAPATGGTVDYLGVFLQQLNGSNNASVCSLQIKITQDIVWYDLVQEIN